VLTDVRPNEPELGAGASTAIAGFPRSIELQAPLLSDAMLILRLIHLVPLAGRFRPSSHPSSCRIPVVTSVTSARLTAFIKRKGKLLAPRCAPPS
jgi:hypothetical protein